MLHVRDSKTAGRAKGSQVTTEVFAIPNTRNPVRDPNAMQLLLLSDTFAQVGIPEWEEFDWLDFALFPSSTGSGSNSGFDPKKGVDSKEIRKAMKAAATSLGIDPARLNFSEIGHAMRKLARTRALLNGSTEEDLDIWGNWAKLLSKAQSTGTKCYSVAPNPKEVNSIVGFRPNELPFIPHLHLFPTYQHPYTFQYNGSSSSREAIVSLLGGEALRCLRDATLAHDPAGVTDGMMKASLQVFLDHFNYIAYSAAHCVPFMQRKFPDWNRWQKIPFQSVEWKNWCDHVYHVVDNYQQHPLPFIRSSDYHEGLQLISQNLHSEIQGLRTTNRGLQDTVSMLVEQNVEIRGTLRSIHSLLSAGQVALSDGTERFCPSVSAVAGSERSRAQIHSDLSFASENPQAGSDSLCESHDFETLFPPLKAMGNLDKMQNVLKCIGHIRKELIKLKPAWHKISLQLHKHVCLHCSESFVQSKMKLEGSLLAI